MFLSVLFLHHLLPCSLLWLGKSYSHFETLLVIFLLGRHPSASLAELISCLYHLVHCYFPVLLNSAFSQSVPLMIFPVAELRQLEKTVNYLLVIPPVGVRVGWRDETRAKHWCGLGCPQIAVAGLSSPAVISSLRRWQAGCHACLRALAESLGAESLWFLLCTYRADPWGCEDSCGLHITGQVKGKRNCWGMQDWTRAPASPSWKSLQQEVFQCLLMPLFLFISLIFLYLLPFAFAERSHFTFKLAL